MKSKIRQSIDKAFPFEPTSQQEELFGLLADFLENNLTEVFILKGYAGTGKTTTIGAVIEALSKKEQKFVLLAPTGRAAKVMTSYSGHAGSTIHRHIYNLRDNDSLFPEFELKENEDSNTLYIVDEGSMIADEKPKEGSNLLGDLITYVFGENTANNKLLIIGDNAQLPPVSCEESPALNAAFVEKNYELTVKDYELTEVKRQAMDSGILFNASVCREQLFDDQPGFVFKHKGFKDVFRVPAAKLIDGIKYSYDKFGIEKTVMLSKSNAEAVRFNKLIRKEVLNLEGSIAEGDRLMCVRNTYNVLPDEFLTDFIANGDFLEVVQVVEVYEKYDLRFAKLELRLLDFDSDKTFFSLVILDSLESSEASLPFELRKQLISSVLKEMNEDAKKGGNIQEARKNPYLNALEVKYAYALTTHKSQGGQWDSVFIRMPRIQDTAMMRWAYTAITRAKTELFLVNPY
jgi:ATP-dependent exoDNAse (exonuclease V) alpha subunit